MKRQSMATVMFGVFTSLILMSSISISAERTLEITKVEDKIVAKTEVFDAVIEAVHHSTVSSRIAAEVIELNFDVNDVVPKDAVILKFHDAEFQARVSQIKASLLADKAQSKEAVARQKEAASEAKRVKNLFKRKLLAQAALDKANADLSASNARVLAIQAQIKARRAQLDEANVQLSYTTIIAPYSGVVTERFIELGEMASPGQHLMTGISLQHLRAVVNIPQYLLGVIKSATAPMLTLTDGREIQGQAVTVIPHADKNSHSFKVRVELAANIEQVYPGMFGKLHFIVGEEQVRVIPQSAIVQRSEVSGVYVQNTEMKLNFRQVRLGRLLANNQREVLAGLSAGEHVALEPLDAVRLLKLNSSRSDI